MGCAGSPSPPPFSRVRQRVRERGTPGSGASRPVHSDRPPPGEGTARLLQRGGGREFASPRAELNRAPPPGGGRLGGGRTPDGAACFVAPVEGCRGAACPALLHRVRPVNKALFYGKAAIEATPARQGTIIPGGHSRAWERGRLALVGSPRARCLRSQERNCTPPGVGGKPISTPLPDGVAACLGPICMMVQ